MTRSFDGSLPFPDAAEVSLADAQLRANLAAATVAIRLKRNRVVSELDEWEDLRLAGEAIKTSALERLDELLITFESQLTKAGGVVHWARDAVEANRIIVDLLVERQVSSVVKIKSMTTAEIGLNQALESAGVIAYETDLAELIVQLGDDLPSHIVVPAIHRSRAEIRSIFAERMGQWGRPAPTFLTDDPADLASAAREHLRERFLNADAAISGANFLVAETGGVVIVESEGNGRMCLTIPKTLISVVGIDKIIPLWEDLDVFLQLLPRSATGERMNPYTSVWTGVTPGDGPQEFHLVLLDNGRTHALADTVGRQALRCIRCAACLNVCPVYERVGGHAYGSVYPGPIGAVLAPQLNRVVADDVAAALPYASTLCGACFDACPVRIDIPRLLVHLRAEVVEANRSVLPTSQEQAVMSAAAWVLGRPRRLELVSRAGAFGAKFFGRRLLKLPGWAGGWSSTRSVPLPREAPFAQWWRLNRSSDAHNPDPARTAHASRRQRTGRSSGANSAPERQGPTGSPEIRGSDGLVIGDLPRQHILDEISEALGVTRDVADVTRAYRMSTARVDTVRTFIERAEEYQAHVSHVGSDQLSTAIAALLEAHGSESIIVPEDLPHEWSQNLSLHVRVDLPHVSVLRLDDTDSVLTKCAVAIAESGTVILDGGVGQGRRVLSLIPDHHIVVVAEDQIVQRITDAMVRIDRAAPQTWISGPSATSDIELNRIEGVHGPRCLDIIVVKNG